MKISVVTVTCNSARTLAYDDQHHDRHAPARIAETLETHDISCGVLDFGFGRASSVQLKHVLVDMMAGGKSTWNWSAYITGNLKSLKSRQRWLGSGVLDCALMAKPARKVGQLLSLVRWIPSAARVKPGRAQP